jgi:uncharacterized protein YqfA (UPF0365 family)
MSLLTLGRENDLSTPSSSRRLSSVAARMALPLTALGINGWRLRLLIRSRKQALFTRLAARLDLLASNLPCHHLAAPDVDHQ